MRETTIQLQKILRDRQRVVCQLFNQSTGRHTREMCEKDNKAKKRFDTRNLYH